MAATTYLLGNNTVSSVFYSTSYNVTGYTGLIIKGIFLEFINSMALVGIVALMFPAMKRYYGDSAFIYSAVRIIESVLLMAGSVCALLLSSMDAGTMQI